MNFKNLAIATAAVFGLTACSSSSDDNTPKEIDSRLSISLDVSGHTTRGVIENPGDQTPEVVKAYAYVMDNATQKFTKELKTGGNGKYTGEFARIPLKGSEKVVVAINKDRVNAQGLIVKEIQPGFEGNPSKANVYYASAPESIVKESDDKYSVEINNIQPIAARLEVFGTLKHHKDLVKEAYIDIVAPNNYTNVYGMPTKVIVSTDNKGDLWKTLSLQDREDIAGVAGSDGDTPNGKVLANHLYAGDEQRVAIRVNAVNYSLQTKQNAYYKVKIGNVEHFVFVGKDSNNDKDVSKEYIKQNGKFYKLDYAPSDGQPVVGSEVQESVLHTYTTSKGTNNEQGGYFSIVKFENLASTENTNYVAGSIYKISLGRIDWNGDGKYDDKDVYDPTINGDGTDEPSLGGDKDLSVEATVANWVIKNTVPGVE